jgi:hypothetical protein
MADAQLRARDVAQAHGIAIVVPSADDLAAKRKAMMEHQSQVATLSKISSEMVSAVSDGTADAG